MRECIRMLGNTMETNQETPVQDVSKKKNGIWETIRFIAISLLVVFAIRYFVAQPFIVSGDSMVPTFENGEYLIVDELSYRFSETKRGGVIIIHYTFYIPKNLIKHTSGP